jgi:hypothetical protein
MLYVNGKTTITGEIMTGYSLLRLREAHRKHERILTAHPVGKIDTCTKDAIRMRSPITCWADTVKNFPSWSSRPILIKPFPRPPDRKADPRGNRVLRDHGSIHPPDQIIPAVLSFKEEELRISIENPNNMTIIILIIIADFRAKNDL